MPIGYRPMTPHRAGQATSRNDLTIKDHPRSGLMAHSPSARRPRKSAAAPTPSAPGEPRTPPVTAPTPR